MAELLIGFYRQDSGKLTQLIANSAKGRRIGILTATSQKQINQGTLTARIHLFMPDLGPTLRDNMIYLCHILWSVTWNGKPECE